MSSNDRQNRYARQQPPRQAANQPYDDDVLYDDGWATNDDQVSQPRRNDVTRTRTSQPAARTRPTIQGTAAQIDELRRNLGQASRGGSDRPRVTIPSRSTTPRVPPRQPAVPADDQVVRGDPAYGDIEWDTATRPAARTRTPEYRAPVRRSPTPQPAEPEYDEYEDDLDAYGYDDEYAGIDDGFSEYDAPSRTVRAPRQRPQIAMPAISRPSLPPAIANADLVNDAAALGLIGTGLASLAAMAILVANRVDTLAPQFATHVNASGLLERFRDESALWNLPLLAAMCTLMNIVIAWFVSPLDRFASRFVLVAALVVQFVAWVAVIRIL